MSAELLTAGQMARRLRISARWLRDEAEAGRIPALRAGNDWLLDAETVERVLLERAKAALKEVARAI